ncbi:MAG: acetyl-CoA carboxylase biotin carboxyl carrier protein [Erysipelotrichaceae bacterium]
MNQEWIKELITYVANTNIDEFAMECDQIKIKMKKTSNHQTQVQHYNTSQQVVSQESLVVKQPVEVMGDVITAPLVGIFYGKSSPSAKAFVEVGSRFQTGDSLCIIEAMKVMNEIKAEKSGVIKEVHLADGDMVAFDQPLFTVAYD